MLRCMINLRQRMTKMKIIMKFFQSITIDVHQGAEWFGLVGCCPHFRAPMWDSARGRRGKKFIF